MYIKRTNNTGNYLNEFYKRDEESTLFIKKECSKMFVNKNNNTIKIITQITHTLKIK